MGVTEKHTACRGEGENTAGGTEKHTGGETEKHTDRMEKPIGHLQKLQISVKTESCHTLKEAGFYHTWKKLQAALADNLSKIPLF